MSIQQMRASMRMVGFHHRTAARIGMQHNPLGRGRTNELGDDDGVLLRHSDGRPEVGIKILVAAQSQHLASHSARVGERNL